MAESRTRPISYGIRPGRAEEAFRLRAIERAAAGVFRAVGLDAAARSEPTSVDGFMRAARDGHLLVAEDAAGQAVGFATFHELDEDLYLQELGVHPDHQRRGLGRRLVDAVDVWAARRGFVWMTLTTFRDVPWNEPWYRRLGFEDVPTAEMGLGLAALRAQQQATWSAVQERVVLRRRVGGTGERV